MKTVSIAAASLALLLTGCSSELVEEFTGCFSMSAAGDRPTLKVIESDGNYSLATRAEGMWGAPVPLTKNNPELAQQVFGDDAASVQASLSTTEGPIALFKIDPEQKIAGGTADSGFLASFFFGTGQVFKTKTCDS